MKKKILLALLILSLASVGSAFARTPKGMALGIQGSFDPLGGTLYPGLGLTFKLPTYPAIIGLGYNLNAGVLGATFDWWFYRTHLFGIVNFYMGPGLGVGLYFNDLAQTIVGLRIPLGFQIFLIDPVELFIEPAPFVTFLPAINLQLQVAIGIRFWF